MATPGQKIRKALDFVRKETKSLSTTSPKRIFVDLGSGDGEGVLQAVEAGYEQAVGVELNWTLYALSQLRRQLYWTKDRRHRSTFLYQDFFHFSVAHADTCMIFGVTPLMPHLSRKLARECLPGTHILSYRFKLPLADKSHPDFLQADLVYDAEEMRVYHCR
jgi:hypothetical protein